MGLTDAVLLRKQAPRRRSCEDDNGFFRYPKQLKEGGGLDHNMHTDIGSLTLLFCESWSLQS